MGTISIGSVFAVWWIISLFVSPLTLPSPYSAIEGLVSLASVGSLFPALWLSVREMYMGLAIGVGAGICIGLLIGTFARVDRVALPYINVLNSIPGVILIPVLIIWLGLGATTRVVFVVLITIWPMVINVRAGVRSSALRYRDLGKVFELSRTAMMRKVMLPASTPYLLAGLRISFGLAIIGMIVGEMDISFKGLGYLLVSFGSSLQTPRLVGVVCLTAFIGLAQAGVVKLVETRFLPWVRHA
jgi:NitT/TauT family transport system permease protein